MFLKQRTKFKGENWNNEVNFSFALDGYCSKTDRGYNQLFQIRK